MRDPLLRKRRELSQEAIEVSTKFDMTANQLYLLARALVATRIFIQVELMVSLRIPPFTSRENLSGDLAIPPPLLLHFVSDILGNFLLLLIVEEDAAAVLCASVATLPVQGSRVVHFVEELDELAVRDFFGVEYDLERFGVCSSYVSNGI
jgi:hypothetical protein